jgi:hypothetical protein
VASEASEWVRGKNALRGLVLEAPPRERVRDEVVRSAIGGSRDDSASAGARVVHFVAPFLSAVSWSARLEERIGRVGWHGDAEVVARLARVELGAVRVADALRHGGGWVRRRRDR